MSELLADERESLPPLTAINLTDDEIIEDAMKRHPECKYGRVYNGMNWAFQMTRVVKLWRNEDCYLNDDPCKFEVEGYRR